MTPVPAALEARRSRGRVGAGAAGLALLVLWSWYGTRVELAALLSGEALGQVARYVARLFPPDLSASALREAAWGAVETFAISLVGSVLATILAVPLALAGARTLLFRGVLYERETLGVAHRSLRMGLAAGSRALLALLRTVPEIAWALLFVFVVGLGPFPGVLALGIHTAGVLGKLFGEVVENVDPRPLETLHAAGASRLAVVLYGVLPQALPHCASYALYRWEVNIRAAAVMGFVGAGGLGQRIHMALSLFHDHQLLTLLLAVYAMVSLVDALSAWLRARLL